MSSIRRQAISFLTRSSCIWINPDAEKMIVPKNRATFLRRAGAGCSGQRGAGNLAGFQVPANGEGLFGRSPTKAPVELLWPERPQGRGGMAAALRVSLDPQGLGLWVIEDQNAHFVGIAGLRPVTGEPGAVAGMAGGIEPLITIHPDHWGQGLASTALGVLIVYARDLPAVATPCRRRRPAPEGRRTG